MDSVAAKPKSHIEIGERFGRLTVISERELYQPSRGKRKARVLCRCDCGTECLADCFPLLKGQRISCGCARVGAPKDGSIPSIGTTFGRLTVSGEPVIRPSPRTGGWARWVPCRCTCGAECFVKPVYLRNGKRKSCGCGHHVRSGKPVHGHATVEGRSPTYRSWCAMLNRCTNPNSSRYKFYGARGVTVCARWKSFESFLADMGERPAGKTIDRIEGARGYEPDNCRWATQKEQVRNRAMTKLTVETAGQIRSLRAQGMTYSAIAARFGITKGAAAKVGRGETWA